MNAIDKEQNKAAPDLVWGAQPIGEVIQRSQRQVFHLLQIGALPAKRVGGRWCASREKLLRAVIGDQP